MPQFDQYIFLPEIFWFLIIYLNFYNLILYVSNHDIFINYLMFNFWFKEIKNLFLIIKFEFNLLILILSLYLLWIISKGKNFIFTNFEFYNFKNFFILSPIYYYD